MAKYNIVVDYGKPFEIKVNNEVELKKELENLKDDFDNNDYPYFDVWVYDSLDNDVTDSIMSSLCLNA